MFIFTHYLEIQLFQRKSTCSGTKIDKGNLAELKDCVEACLSDSSMFIFAKKGDSGCRCEIEAGEDGCDTVASKDYDLFRYTGNFLIK